MFTGIVEELGRVVRLDLAPGGDDARLRIAGPVVTGDVGHGDSIAVDGVCLTVVAAEGDEFEVDVMGETLRRTTIGSLAVGSAVNLERSVTPAGRLGGHVVQGHVDGVGTVADRVRHERWDTLVLTVPAEVGRFLAPKGAIAVGGVSLTVVDVTDGVDHDGGPGTRVSIGIIPETQRATTLGAATPGSAVNIEVDVMAKYVERLLGAAGGTGPAAEQR